MLLVDDSVNQNNDDREETDNIFESTGRSSNICPDSENNDSNFEDSSSKNWIKRNS